MSSHQSIKKYRIFGIVLYLFRRHINPNDLKTNLIFLFLLLICTDASISCIMLIFQSWLVYLLKYDYDCRLKIFGNQPFENDVFPWVYLGRLFKCFILVISLKNYRKINYLAIYWMSNVRMSKLKLQAKHRVGKKWQ